MIDIRPANEHDVGQIREIYSATYGKDYAYPQYYDEQYLKKMVYSDDTILLVAEDTEQQRVVGTASVIVEIGAFTDLVGEFGRLAVHPDARRQGIGHLLMQGRIDRVGERLHLGLVEARASHPYSQKISQAHGFVPVGFLPLKLRVAERESLALFARYFGDGLTLRRNHPRVIPEVYSVAEMALENVGLTNDCVVDVTSPPYPEHEYQIDEITSQGYSTLLRFERGRVRHREIVGPVSLHYGMFKLRAKHSNYLLARENGHTVGAIGYTVDEVEQAVRIFELVSLAERPVRFLLRTLIDRCREAEDIDYVEVDVNACVPRMQRTLLELGFVPAAYVPAMVFHHVERLDVVKMVYLFAPFDITKTSLVESVAPFATLVQRDIGRQEVLPQVAEMIPSMRLFAGLNEEQGVRLASICQLRQYAAGDTVYAAGQAANHVYLVKQGTAEVNIPKSNEPIATVHPGECIGEISLLHEVDHTATVSATSELEVAAMPRRDLMRLIRRRPDIGMVIYRNLAAGLGDKLHRINDRAARILLEK